MDTEKISNLITLSLALHSIQDEIVALVKKNDELQTKYYEKISMDRREKIVKEINSINIKIHNLIIKANELIADYTIIW